LMCSFNLPSKETRNKFLAQLYENKMIMLGCGAHSVRFRPSLIVTKKNIDDGILKIKNVLYNLHRS